MCQDFISSYEESSISLQQITGNFTRVELEPMIGFSLGCL